MELAKIAYEAYMVGLDDFSYVPFDELPENIQKAWDSVATAVWDQSQDEFDFVM